MPNFDDLFTGQPTQQEEQPFDKTVWAARKQAEREGVYAMIDSYTQDMSKGRAGCCKPTWMCRHALTSLLREQRHPDRGPMPGGHQTGRLRQLEGQRHVCPAGERMPSPSWNRARSISGTMVAWACPTMCGRYLTFPRPGPPSAPPPLWSGMNGCC